MDEKRINDSLRTMIDAACKGLLPHIQDRIKDAARRAYYLGCEDGIQMKPQVNDKENAA